MSARPPARPGVNAPRPDADVVVVPVPDDLRRKALTMHGDAEDNAARAVKQAQKALDALAPEFDALFREEVRILALRHASYLEARDAATRANLFRAAHDLRGSAATLGYPLAGRMAQSLSRLLSLVEDPPARLVAAHIDAIQAIARERVKNAADPVGAALAEELDMHAERMIEPDAG
jgi:chemotaxis protein histidine kinase CheA